MNTFDERQQKPPKRGRREKRNSQQQQMSANIYNSHRSSTSSSIQQQLSRITATNYNTDVDVESNNNNKRRKLVSVASVNKNDDGDDNRRTAATNKKMKTSVNDNQNGRYRHRNHQNSNITSQVLAVSSREHWIHSYPTPSRTSTDGTATTKIVPMNQTPRSGGGGGGDMMNEESSLSSMSLFAMELNVAHERNTSESFQQLYRTLWKYVQTVPELLHHGRTIVELLIQAMVTKTTTETNTTGTSSTSRINYATVDSLHLLGVLAREIRHEIHPYLHTMILPTLWLDILNPTSTGASSSTPTTTNSHCPIRNDDDDDNITTAAPAPAINDDDEEKEDNDIAEPVSDSANTTTNDNDSNDNNDDVDDKDEEEEDSSSPPPPPPMLDVGVIELLFRTVSYIFKYDQRMILLQQDDKETNESPLPTTATGTIQQQQSQLGFCEIMIQRYYTVTIGHPNAYIRRLSAETFAPLLRQLHLQQPPSQRTTTKNMKKKKTKNPLVKHIQRTVRALSYNTPANTSSSLLSSSSISTSSTTTNASSHQAAIDGISYLFYEISRNGPTRLHTKCGPLIVTTLLDLLMVYTIPIVLPTPPTPTKDHSHGTTTINSNNIISSRRNSQIVIDVIQGTFQLWLYSHQKYTLDVEHVLLILNTIIQTILHKYIGGGTTSDNAIVATSNTDKPLIQCESALIVSLQILQQYFVNSRGASSTTVLQRLIPIIEPLFCTSSRNLNTAPSKTTITESNVFLSMSGTCQVATLELIYTTLISLLQPDTSSSKSRNTEEKFFLQMIDQLSDILTIPIHQTTTPTSSDQMIGVVAHHVVQHCLPYIMSSSSNSIKNGSSSSSSSSSRMVGSIVSAIVRSAIKMAHDDGNDILPLDDVVFKILHGLVSVRMRNANMNGSYGDNDDNNTDVMFFSRAMSCFLPDDDLNAIPMLLNRIFLKDMATTISFDTSEKDCANIVAACKVSSFLVVLGMGMTGVITNDDNDTDDDSMEEEIDTIAISDRVLNNYTQVAQWHTQIIQKIDAIHSQCKTNGMATTGTIGTTSYRHTDTIMSMAIESLSCLSLTISQNDLYLQSDTISNSIKSAMGKIRSMVIRHLLANPNNLWALKSTGKFVEELQTLGMNFDMQIEGQNTDDDLFDALLPCLRSRYHFQRFPALQILSALPKRPYVVDHADLDVTDDLDEEQDKPTSAAARTATTTSYVGLSGPCNMMDLLLSIESMPVNMQTERSLLSDIARIGVIGRTGKLPVMYAEAAVSHMIGLLNIKFSPIWPVAVKSLIDLTLGHEDVVWPALHDQISTFMELYPPINQRHNIETINPLPIDPLGLYSVCRSWEMSNGADTSLFTHEIHGVMQRGRVSRHHASDASSVATCLWSVVQGAPKLITVHSRTIVPIFLRFIYYQYYTVHVNDPDSREIDIVSTLTEIDDNADSIMSRFKTNEILLNGRQVQQRLCCIAKAFASVNGPQQLFKHKLLLSIFVSFLGSQDNNLSQAALSFVLKFKLPYLVQYTDTLKKFYEKGMLRDAMMQMNSDVDSGKINPDHRPGLIPILSRILFGRLSSRGGGAKSSKDSPSARRTAVVSFLSSFCHDDDELYPFLYLMIRVYIPTNYTMRPIEMQNKKSEKEIMNIIVNTPSYDYSSIPVQVHQGFLNVLESVISQLGRKMIPFVSTFMAIIVKLCKTYEIRGKGELRDLSANLDDDDDDAADDGDTICPSDRTGSIRSLCFTRLANIFASYSDVVDFSQYNISLWESLDHSLRLLPIMALNSDKVPSLLYMLRIMSGEGSLVGMLQGNEQIVPSVLLCLSGRSKNAVIETVLVFIDNLLEFDDGRKLLQQHIELMLHQFVSRMGCASTAPIRNSSFKSQNHNIGQTTWRRELSILCKVSELIDDTSYASMTNESTSAMETMCELLIPYLDINRGIPDPDKQRIIDILEVMIEKVSPASAADHYANLAALLGPFKAKAGIVSLSLRKSLAAVLGRIANTSYKAAISSTRLLQRLCAVSGKRIDEMDYDLAIPAISDVGTTAGELGWLNLSMAENDQSDPYVLLPVVYTCFNFLFHDDGVVSRGSFNALTALVVVASKEGHARTNETWRKFLEGIVVPLIKSGLNSHVEFSRRFYVLLLKEVIQQNKDESSHTLFSDLSCLIRHDEPDLDFFLNITHVQLHRRARALQRLRKTLNEEDTASNSFSLQSLSSVLLPLATHPIYEGKSKLDENFALEGIATVGAISRHLSWSKYNSLLWNHLTQFERHPELEKYLIGLICAIIDGFHFKVDSAIESNNIVDPSSLPSTNSVWRALENRIIPKIENLMVKAKTDRKGAMLRPSVLLALHKLIHKLPTALFQSKLPHLLAVVCDALRKRESDARDLARVSLAKMVVEMDMEYLPDVLRELATSLTEGYKLHVRNATIHTILLEIAKVYKPPEAIDFPVLPTFDKTVPAFMDLIQQDIFGEAQERRDAQGNQVRFVKEAGGAKSANSLELIATMILFRPTAMLQESSVHMLVTPLLERIRTPGVSITVTKRIKECLARIVSGLLRNPSIQNGLVMQFVYATLDPFVSKHEIELVMELMDDDVSSDDDDHVKPIQVSGKRKSREIDGSKETRGHLVEWRPSTLKAVTTTKAARSEKEKHEFDSFKVQDGANAPKLTGSARVATANGGGKQNTVNDTATVCAVVFGLQLLSPMLKNWNEGNNTTDNKLLDRFVPLLTTCVCRCRNTDVVLLALRCLGYLLKTDLPSLSRCSKSLAAKTLELITSAGSNQELLQSTFKMLTFLISFDHTLAGKIESGVRSGNNPLVSKTLPLNDEQLQVLLSFLRESVVSTDQHNPAIALIKAIMSRRYVSVEFYDLMETMLEQSVRSSKSTLRDQSGIVFIHYLINYPLSAEKVEQHLNQVVLNLSYEYAEGRISAITLASMIVDKVPQPVIEKHCQLFFFPLSLQLVNDDSQDCRELVAKCVGKLLRSVSTDVLQTLFEYMTRWLDGDVSLQRMSLQLLKILVEIRPDFVKRIDTAKTILQKVYSLMTERCTDWEIQYFALLLVEVLIPNFNHHVIQSEPLWECIVESMVNDHVWVKLAAVRLLSNHIQGVDPNNMTSSQTFFMNDDIESGLLFRMARNLCYQLGVDESQQIDDMTTVAIKVLTWTVQAATTYPSLCYSRDGTEEHRSNVVDNEEDDDSIDNDDERAKTMSDHRPNPVQWIITRLSNLARLKGTKRRQSIFKCFAAFITMLPSKDVTLYPYLENIIAPLYRVEIETKNDVGDGTNYLMLLSKRSSGSNIISEEGQLAKDVLQLLESHCTECNQSDMFLQAYQNVQTRSKERKDRRKSARQVQVVTNPTFAAQQRMDKQVREKHRRQRRVQERRMDRGGGSTRRQRDD